jgi:hypothetical protein
LDGIELYKTDSFTSKNISILAYFSLAFCNIFFYISTLSVILTIKLRTDTLSMNGWSSMIRKMFKPRDAATGNVKVGNALPSAQEKFSQNCHFLPSLVLGRDFFCQELAARL